MRVRTTSTGLEAKAPARPHTKLDLQNVETRVTNDHLVLPPEKDRTPIFEFYYNLDLSSMRSGDSQEVRVHSVPHVARQDQVLLGDVIDRKLNADHDGCPLRRQRNALMQREGALTPFVSVMHLNKA